MRAVSTSFTAEDVQGPVLLAIASHFIFHRYEPSAFLVIILYVSGAAVDYVTLSHNASLLKVLVHLTLYTSTLMTSIGVYRLLLHRVRHFPGPTSLALSKWASVPMDLAGSRPERIDQLHQKYGNVVRTGPREVSINDVKAVSAVLGANSGCIKGPWYLAVHAGKGPRSKSLHATVEQKDHRARRRIWDAGFSVSALKEYQPELQETLNKMVSQLETRADKGETVALDHWCQFFAFDIMGKLGFSRSFDLLGKGDFSKPIELLEGAMQMLMPMGCVPYMADVARLLPNPLRQFEGFTEDALKERVNRSTPAADLYSHLLGEDKETGWKHTWNELNADAGLIVVAGSDTSSSVMTMTLYLLVQHPKIMQQIRDELESVFAGEEADDMDRLAKDCPVLNAVINESMRLYPPVPSGLPRITPAQGMTVSTDKGQIVIPGNVVVTVPTTTLHRDPRYWSPKPNDFRPERWMKPEKEEAFDKNAFIPFGYGPTGCVGKNLAWMEMRLVLATLLRRFDLSFAPGFDQKAYPRCIKDYFTAARTQSLPIKLKRRQKERV